MSDNLAHVDAWVFCLKLSLNISTHERLTSDKCNIGLSFITDHDHFKAIGLKTLTAETNVAPVRNGGYHHARDGQPAPPLGRVSPEKVGAAQWALN